MYNKSTTYNGNFQSTIKGKTFMLYIFTEWNYELSNNLLSFFEDSKNVKLVKTKELARYNSKFADILSKIFYLLKLPCFANFNKNIKIITKNIKQEDSVLIWGSLSPVLLTHFSKLVKTRRKYIWLWNSMFTYNPKKEMVLKLKKNYQIYTFDSEDADEYGFSFKNQVCYQQILQNAERKDFKSDIYFVGQDKGRYDQIENLYNQLKDKFICDFRIIKDTTSKDEHKYNLFSSKVSFEENIELIGQSKCVLEIVQNGQSGITLRSLEALISGRKLISNNKELLKADFYDKNNIFIIGVDEDIADFMNNPKCVCKNYDKYLISNWIKEFE